MDGYYVNKSTLECMKCDVSCKTCKNTEPSGCLSCKSWGVIVNFSYCKYTCPS